MQDNNLFSTSDFALATTLVYFGFQLAGMNQNGLQPNKINFLFDRSKKLETIVSDYWDDKLQISPRKWFSMSKEMKNRIYDFRGSGL